ncbi:MAG: SUMF1/EgtB/PvdO family nonheme iron enzyme [Cyclobacteriaceae bacterium]|nr:SUMF1/EgtB/PvdO family nonheme iron enzyme [Cyclobacteriaceae bacterium]
MKFFTLCILICIATVTSFITIDKARDNRINKTESYINSIGIKMIAIDAGTFTMGSNESHWQESPARRVNISQSFFISETEITAAQYRQFQQDRTPTQSNLPFMTGISWYEAMEFCAWLSEKEGKPYRLPTEAEWEYACKLSLEKSPDKVIGMIDSIPEWCFDWYGPYPYEDQKDPVGAMEGLAKVVRGGSLDTASRFHDKKEYAMPTNRSAMAPAFRHYEEDIHNYFGFHNIGFRVVQAPMPATKANPVERPFTQQGVKQTNRHLNQGPVADIPYFRKRYVLPAPPETRPYNDRASIDAAGLHPAIRPHNHCPSLAVCDNGDLLYIVYTSYNEYEINVSFISSRLRFGADEWDMPDLQIDFPGANNHAPLLWNDHGTLYLFWGNPNLVNSFPFQYIVSTDNGASWSEVKFPFVKNKSKFSPTERKQPINTVIHDLNGTMYVPADGFGGSSVLWATDDKGQTWYDTNGRTYGRHTTFALLKDGSILGMGGKSTDIAGFMPKSISNDGGKSWQVSQTPFPAQGNGQRPSVLRLQSGRLFFAGDFYNKGLKQPEGPPNKGSYVALSEDEGHTWHIKELYGADSAREDSRVTTIGYSVARQSPNGMIHLITSINRQALHFEFNEAWILSNEHRETKNEVIMASSAKRIETVESYKEYYPNGKVKTQWSGGIANDGRFVLHGPETWYHENGQVQREANYLLGKKAGIEKYMDKNGVLKWQWEHKHDGNSTWTQWWPNGTHKSISTWNNFMANGMAKRWDQQGNIISEVEFIKGFPEK